MKKMFDSFRNSLYDITFDGRASGKECGIYILFLIAFLAAFWGLIPISFLLGYPVIGLILGFLFVSSLLASFIPTIAMFVRRLHDQEKSGSYLFVFFIPVIGGVWLLVLLCTEGTHGENLYGPDPKAVSEQQV